MIASVGRLIEMVGFVLLLYLIVGESVGVYSHRIKFAVFTVVNVPQEHESSIIIAES